MSEAAGRAVAIPYAFDTGIGYWTGELDWELLVRAVRALGEEMAPSSIDAWAAAARAGGSDELCCCGVTLVVEEALLIVRGEGKVVERAARRIERELGLLTG